MQNQPERLYKYRKFNDRTLEMLVVDRLYFADPSTFNDPLDTKPSLRADLTVPELERTLFQLVEERIKSEMTAAAKTIKYRGPKTIEHIQNQSRVGAKRLIDEVQYHADDPAHEGENPHHFLLSEHIEGELLRRYETGIFSLAERVDCPLMWSHYGDQHRGICAGFSIPPDAGKNLHKIRYGGSRVVKASEVAAMLNGNDEPRQKVDAAVLLRKAKDWHYEHEWRLIDQRGTRDSTLELEEVIFGMRCSTPVKFAVMKALEGRVRPVKLFQISERPGTFILDKFELDKGELGAQLPRRSRSAWEGFEAVRLPIANL
jgi:hypothetical protein